MSFVTKKTFPSSPWIPYNLRNIDLSYNLMSIITHDLKFGTKTVQQLNLSNNNIKDIRTGVLGNLTSLEILDLSHNELRVVDNDVFNFTANFTALHLNDNKIENISYSNLIKLNYLNVLDLRHNLIKQFDADLVNKMKKSNLTVYFDGEDIIDSLFVRLFGLKV